MTCGRVVESHFPRVASGGHSNRAVRSYLELLDGVGRRSVGRVDVLNERFLLQLPRLQVAGVALEAEDAVVSAVLSDAFACKLWCGKVR